MCRGDNRLYAWLIKRMHISLTSSNYDYSRLRWIILVVCWASHSPMLNELWEMCGLWNAVKCFLFDLPGNGYIFDTVWGTKIAHWWTSPFYLIVTVTAPNKCHICRLILGLMTTQGIFLTFNKVHIMRWRFYVSRAILQQQTFETLGIPIN